MFLLTSAQLHALEAARTGDLRLELDIKGTLPQASGYPGGGSVTEYITVAKSRWCEQLAGLGHAVAFEMSVPFPVGDEPRAEAVGYLRDVQRRLWENDIDGAIQLPKAAVGKASKDLGNLNRSMLSTGRWHLLRGGWR